MRKTILSVLGMLFLGGWLCDPLVGGLQGQTLDDVLAKYYQAHGGLDKLKAVTAMKMSGKIIIPAQGLEMPMVRWQKAPDKLRVETVVQDKKIIQGFDGRTAWWLNPLLAADAREMSQDQGQLFREQADFENPLVVFREKGYKLELLDKEEFEGKPVFKLRLIKTDGKEIYFYLDAESGIGLKSSLAVKTGESSSLVEIIYSDYRLVDGQPVPFGIENRTDGKLQARLVLEAVEVNPVMNDAIFASPEKKEAPKAESRK
jgi:hypothetical protein